MDLVKLRNHNGSGECEYCLKIAPKASMYMDLEQRAWIKLVCAEYAADYYVERYGAVPAGFGVVDLRLD
jgi:hypothetical protein